MNRIYILVPLRRPLWKSSKAAFVISLNPEVRAPEAANPAIKDCSEKITCKRIAHIGMYNFKTLSPHRFIKITRLKEDLDEFRTHQSKISNHPTLHEGIGDSKRTNNDTQGNIWSNPSFSRCDQIQLFQKVKIKCSKQYLTFSIILTN